jgi:putative superfamily III holin-X
MHTETKPLVAADPQESLGGLLGDLMKHSTALIKGEIALIRSELLRKIVIFRMAAVLTAIGFVLILLAGMAFLFAGILALAAYIGLVASALICGGLVGGVAAVLLSKGVGHFKRLTI